MAFLAQEGADASFDAYPYTRVADVAAMGRSRAVMGLIAFEGVAGV
ncbi:hypothetical protein JOE54_003587 [Brachybacterium tyrofermentans]